MVKPKVSIIMGSDSDLTVMKEAADVLEEFAVPFEITIVSAHRTPKRLYDFAGNAHKRGIEVIIAGAGGAAHLPGMTAAISPLPVIGVPVKSSNSIDGWDSILSIVQMPGGVPVAAVALNGAKNAGLLAVQILSVRDKKLRNELINYKDKMNRDVMSKVKKWSRSGGKKRTLKNTGKALN
ncbi:MAG: 5-(carboxyamino)imidazole ribonucleotide mutase [Ignavibacteria bacterium]|jgi:5-(carboxyamino)imidazole ribonucleotide mutase|nr:5-(carboxyamino)imidazole ribonucleotide mutase [Ignavibacteria bacterium]